ncbi:uncharacterized protein [Venturia canescens]|uniref:uncharacterized protein n=1 Tax=Venturia canescens TaxID=32260 RepID=UPI001C9D2A42|nr:uncharacterized protein LOC122407174 [Venturia canescens]
MRAGCHITLSKHIRLKKAVINVKSNDNACFGWAIVAALHPAANHSDRSSSYPHYSTILNLAGINFPMTLDQINKFESLNNLSINIYSAPNDVVQPIRLSKQKRERHINLLYIEDVMDTNVGHFAWIKNLSHLVSKQLNTHNGRKYICDRCLHYFSSHEKLQSHEVDCGEMNNCAILLPNAHDKWLEFKNVNRKELLPFIVYADLECILKKTTAEDMDRNKYQHHQVFSVGYYVNCSYDESLSGYHTHRGEDCVQWFVRRLEQLAKQVATILYTIIPMNELTPQEWRKFRENKECHICEKSFVEYDVRVRDHCHLTGKFRGPAHQDCNLKYQESFFIPIVFHNLSGYDAHFIIKEVATAFEGKTDLLPITKEKYISFSKTVITSKDYRKNIKLRFIDPYRFLNTSLDKLASFLTHDQLTVLKSEFRDTDNFNLLTRKGVFPYEYIDSFDRLEETALPPRESFYSSLTDSTVSESEYAHALTVWERFSTQTLGEYSDLYLKTDVLLLADIFENFRNTCLKSYGLDPAYYYTLPGYTWDAMMRYTKIRFELLTDIDMVLFVERGIRGGLSQCSGRYARANNKYMPSYDPSEPSTFLMYYDVNNLYGWAMSQALPYDQFEFIENVENFDVESIPLNGTHGYLLEVDLEYPEDLHDIHSDLPFCPSHEKPPGKQHEKLIASLQAKKRYIIHYRALQQCLKHGVKLTKIHRILKFRQSSWLQKYIDLNTQFRTNAKNEFEKNLFKLMNNAVFGKTMEDVRSHVQVKLLTEWAGRFGAEAMIAKPNFHSRSIFAENLIAVELRNLQVKFNKPIYVGMSILDISKTCLYEFHHEFMSPIYQNKCKILYTDTDSLIYHIECDDVYNDMKNNLNKYDTSDYPIDNKYNIPLVNKKVPGLMKDENNGAIMTEFVGLRSKMYATRVLGKNDVKKAKGVSSNVVARTITFDDYTKCLNEEIEMKRTQASIRSTLHNVYTIKETKIALSPHDDKRYIIPGTVNTLPWGHRDIP